MSLKEKMNVKVSWVVAMRKYRSKREWYRTFETHEAALNFMKKRTEKGFVDRLYRQMRVVKWEFYDRITRLPEPFKREQVDWDAFWEEVDEELGFKE